MCKAWEEECGGGARYSALIQVTVNLVCLWRDLYAAHASLTSCGAEVCWPECGAWEREAMKGGEARELCETGTNKTEVRSCHCKTHLS